ncbi:membrane protein [Candidatus Methylomirabilis lanthanidiphila]|uniref:Membrane protein n=1 Tax=Candidatus Methylomirabilis lanthanidiphila TaxID=2211376 RepID=A0A564ZH95_9BACT|nr:tetratricopeptide repeat protein [Candidatus Methylomirabilis lanthanidiphila]VUZ84711.1 membrane protein [Candidatus Methylomirabilis lanthanidiphila]
MPDPGRLELAEFYFKEGHRLQTDGDLDGAIAAYQRSIELYPTAEAHTFLGWAYSFQGQIDEAIKQCEVAIRIDPEFGNPYNDIGVYLIEKGEYDEAIPWLEKAMVAKRYEPRHYPYMNMGRILVRKGKYEEAARELKKALDIEPNYAAARIELHKIFGLLN